MFGFSKYHPYQLNGKKNKIVKQIEQIENKMETTYYNPKQWYGLFYNAMGRSSYCTSTGLCRIKGNKVSLLEGEGTQKIIV